VYITPDSQVQKLRHARLHNGLYFYTYFNNSMNINKIIIGVLDSAGEAMRCWSFSLC